VQPLFRSLKLAWGHHLPHDAGYPVGPQVDHEAFSGHCNAPNEQPNDAGLFSRKELIPKLGKLLQGVDGICFVDICLTSAPMGQFRHIAERGFLLCVKVQSQGSGTKPRQLQFVSGIF
jgi:hypothetical protein